MKPNEPRTVADWPHAAVRGNRADDVPDDLDDIGDQRGEERTSRLEAHTRL